MFLDTGTFFVEKLFEGEGGFTYTLGVDKNRCRSKADLAGWMAVSSMENGCSSPVNRVHTGLDRVVVVCTLHCSLMRFLSRSLGGERRKVL